VSENAGNAIVNVRRNGNTNGSSSVFCQTSDGTAIAGTNYTATSGVLTFGVGETSKNITIPIIDDNFFNGDKTFTVALSNPSGATLSSPTTATGTIVESDALSCVTAPSGLVSWWPGDNTAIDIQSGNNGTLQNGATFASGLVDQAFSFDGSSSVSVADAANLMPSVFTVDAWIYPTIAGPGYTRILEKGGYDGDHSGTGYGLLFNVIGDQRAQFEIWNGGYNGYQDVTSTTRIPLNTWTHIAGTFDGSTMTIYVNGVPEASLSGATMIPNTLPLTLGRASRGQFDLFTGLIDEVEIFNRALDATEIQAIYYAGSAGHCKSMVFYVSNWGNNTIEKFDANGADLGTFASSGLAQPCSLAFDSSGNLYVANLINSTIEKFDSHGNGVVFANAGLNHPIGLAFDSSGNLYVSNYGSFSS
jgi:hypothetical protein